jgi:Ubiquitin family
VFTLLVHRIVVSLQLGLLLTKDLRNEMLNLLQCIIEKFGKCTVDDHDVQCPYKDCHAVVPNPKTVADECQLELELLYPPIHSTFDTKQQLQVDLSDADKTINVVMLTGDSAIIPFKPEMTIEQLKDEIQKKLNVAPDKQHLTYDDLVLDVRLLNSTYHQLNVLCA